jgi:hypothetical protein
MRKNKLVISSALWIKEYAHALRVLAGVFFIFALITGIAWIAGCNVGRCCMDTSNL